MALRWLPAPGLSLRLASDPSSLAAMRRELRAWLDEAGVSEEDAHDILVACSEACANAIVHAADPASASPEFELIGSRHNGEISLVVRDSGGFGLRLMEALMDEVEVATRETGTDVRLRRRLKPPSTNGA